MCWLMKALQEVLKHQPAKCEKRIFRHWCLRVEALALGYGGARCTVNVRDPEAESLNVAERDIAAMNAHSIPVRQCAQLACDAHACWQLNASLLIRLCRPQFEHRANAAMVNDDDRAKKALRLLMPCRSCLRSESRGSSARLRHLEQSHQEDCSRFGHAVATSTY